MIYPIIDDMISRIYIGFEYAFNNAEAAHYGMDTRDIIQWI